MNTTKPFVLSIAGFDPSAGAGLLADIKTFEMLNTYGLGVCTAITFQNENEFDGLEWMSFLSIQKQLEVLFRKYQIDVIKIGLIENLTVLSVVLSEILKHNAQAKIIWDPILKASAGFDFHSYIDQSIVKDILSRVFLVTPNLPEAIQLVGRENDPIECATILSRHCNVFLKGGHGVGELANDILFITSERYSIEGKRINNGAKHGSGCVLSSAIAANLANEMSLKESCAEAKLYMNKFLKSNESLLGYHTINHLGTKITEKH